MSTQKHWTTLRQRKISRRTMLGASAKAGVGAAGLALVGCGDDDEPDAGAVAAERAASAAEEAAAAAIAAGEARAAETEAAADAAAEAAAAASEASAAASQAADAADAAAALAADAAESEDAANAAAAAEAAAAAAADAAAAASAAGDQAAAAVAAAASEAAEAAAQAARDAAAAVEAGTATAEAAQAAIDEAAEAAAAAAAAAGEASAAAGAAAATAQETAEAAAETAAAAVAAAQEAADAAQEAAESAAMVAEDEAPATGPQQGGIITWHGGDGGILDPAIADHGFLDSSIFPVYDHLNYLDEGGVLTSAMAELPEVVDDVTFVYTIKPNVHWQDKAPLNGRQFVAEDASFGLQRFGQDNPEFIWRDRFAAVDQFEVTDELTLRLTLGEVFAPLLTAVGEIQMLMVARDVVEAFGDDAIASDAAAAIGTGGMQMVSREADVQTELERNPNYYREGLPYINGLRANWNADGAYRAAQFVAGESDILFAPWLGFPAENAAVRGQVGEENLVEVPMNATWNWTAVHFHTKIEPYGDPRVRTALHLATDREQLVATTQGVTEIGGPISHAIGAYAWTVDELRQRPGYRSGAQREEDLAEGRRLLDASGYDPASVPPMTAAAGYGTAYAEVMQQNFAEIGFEVAVHEQPDSENNTLRAAGEFTLTYQGLGGAFDPDVLYGLSHSEGGRNFGEFSDPGLDALLDQGRTTLAAEDRLPIYDEVQTKLLELNPQIYCNWGRPVVGHRPWLKGYGPTNSSTAATYRWYRSWFEGKPGV